MSTRTKNATYSFPYHALRNISSPEDTEADRRVLVGHAPASSFLELDDDENVREYLVTLPGKKKSSPTRVHRAIRETLNQHPDRFSVLNSGICVVARGAEVDDKARIAHLKAPSIINGSQTNGELRRYFRGFNGSPPADPSVKFEIIVTSDDDLIAEVSIARNFQNDVQPLSIAGRRGQLDELEAALQSQMPGVKLKKSESDLAEDFEDTEKLIQVLFALSPQAVWDPFPATSRLESKATTYSQKTHLLRRFSEIVEEAKAPEPKPEFVQLYQYCLDMAGTAWREYTRWRIHQGFVGTRIQKIERENGRILQVPDGIIFPIIASMAAFVRKVDGHWVLYAPPKFDEKKLIEAAAQDYQEIAGHNPQTMGKTSACYSSLFRITSIYADLLPQRN